MHKSVQVWAHRCINPAKVAYRQISGHRPIAPVYGISNESKHLLKSYSSLDCYRWVGGVL